MRCYVIVLCTLLAIATAAKVNYNGYRIYFSLQIFIYR